MKTFILMTITAAISISASLVNADSKIKRSDIEVYSNNQEAYSQANGKKSLASVGSVNLRDSRVIKSEVYVDSYNKYSEAFADRDESTSTVGSFTAE